MRKNKSIPQLPEGTINGITLDQLKQAITDIQQDIFTKENQLPTMPFFQKIATGRQLDLMRARLEKLYDMRTKLEHAPFTRIEKPENEPPSYPTIGGKD